MGRHRSDALGIARPAFVGLAVVVLLALIFIGARALMTALEADGAPEAASSDSPAADARPATSPASTERVPTVRLVCRADECPVFVRVPGGEVLIDRDLARGEQASYFEPELDVVLDDASTVQVFENGTPRAAGRPGERESFTVKRALDR